MRKILVGFIVVLVIASAVYIRLHRTKSPLEAAYAGGRGVTLWNSTAQVRAPVTTVPYGERLEILRRFEDQAQVRTSSGAVGWIDAADLITGDLWEKSQVLTASTAALPIEARGHTRALSNVHLEPGRDAPRVRQLEKNVPLNVYKRQVVEMTPSTPARTTNAGEPPSPDEARKEDWWLIRAQVPGEPAVAGWILGQFIDLDVPQPLPDYASSAGMRIVAWFELNHAADLTGTPRPQYLVLGTRGPDGQPCDFSTLRVYTWGKQHQRYETAFVQSDLCGQLPVKFAPRSASGDVTFTFADSSTGTRQDRTYVMRQTIVRLLRPPGSSPESPRKHR